MNSTIYNITQSNQTLEFDIENIHVSFINGIRRCLLSEIPSYVFETFPYEKNKVNIIENTTRLNNEIIKQRLSSIPIHIKATETDDLVSSLIFELDIENTGESIMYVTTNDFKIKNKNLDKYLPQTEVSKIFPVNEMTKDPILISRLRPKINDEIKGEKLKLEGTLTKKIPKQNSAYNQVSTASYSFLVDEKKQQKVLDQKIEEWQNYGLTKEEITFEKQNWKLLDGKRITKDNAFHFIIETIGVYDNKELLIMSCDILIQKLLKIITLMRENKIQKNTTNNTLDNSVDYILENEDYTIGKIIEYIIFRDLFQNDNERRVSMVGFHKEHPTFENGILRVVFTKIEYYNNSNELIVEVLKKAVKEMEELKNNFISSL